LAVAIHCSFLKENKSEQYNEKWEDNRNSQLHIPTGESKFSTEGRTNEEKVSFSLYM